MKRKFNKGLELVAPYRNRELEARKAPKKMDLGDGPTGTAARATDQQVRAKAARQSKFDKGRAMDTAE